MEKITVNRIRYISLAEFNHIRRNLVKDIVDKYEKDENGTRHLSEFDRGRVEALTHIMTVIMDEEIHDAETPDEIREMHRKLDVEYTLHRYIIVGTDEETGQRVFFRKYCDITGDDELTPVFTSIGRLAKSWSDHYWATVVCNRLRDKAGDSTLRVEPAWIYLLPPGEAEKRLIKAIFGDSEPEYHGDGTRAEDEDWDGK